MEQHLMMEKFLLEKALYENVISLAVKEAEYSKIRTTLSAVEANLAKRRVVSAAAEAEAAADVAEEAVGSRSLNVVDVASQAVITAQAAAVRARIACFEAQLAEGKAEVWYDEAGEAWFRVRDNRERLYNYIVESEFDIARSVDEIDENAVIS